MYYDAIDHTQSFSFFQKYNYDVTITTHNTSTVESLLKIKFIQF